MRYQPKHAPKSQDTSRGAEVWKLRRQGPSKAGCISDKWEGEKRMQCIQEGGRMGESQTKIEEKKLGFDVDVNKWSHEKERMVKLKLKRRISLFIKIGANGFINKSVIT